MRLIYTLVLCALLFSARFLCAAEPPKFDGSKIFDAKTASESSQNAAKRFKRAFENYYDRLESARTYEAKKGNVEAVVEIEDALEGEAITTFDSKLAQSARDKFDKELARALDAWQKDLNRDVKQILIKGDTETGVHIQNVTNEIDAALQNLAPAKSTSSKDKTIKFTVAANKDWQNTGIQLQKGSTVTWTASGIWGPGIKSRTGKKRWSDVKGGPDTYKVKIRVGNKNVGSGGTSYSFTAPNDGELSLRMDSPNPGRRGDAEGTVTVDMDIDDPITLKDEGEKIEDLETFVIRIMTPAAVAAADGDGTTGDTPPAAGKAINKKFMLDASKGIQDTGIDLNAGDKVVITTIGKWTNGNTKAGEPPYKTVDKFKMLGFVGGSRIGRGTSNWIFFAPQAGRLKIGMAGYGNFVKKGFAPKGHLTLTIIVMPKE